MRPFKTNRMLLAAPMLFTTTLLVAQDVAEAVPSGDKTLAHVLSLSQVFTVFFLTLGPFKVIGPYAKMTHGLETSEARKFAIKGIFFASMVLLLTGLLGEKMLNNFGISIPVLALTGGIILFHVALTGIFNQFGTPQAPTGKAEALTPGMAMSPLAIPTIVTPYGIAALIIIVALQNDWTGKLMIAGMLLGVMTLNLLAMLYARIILKNFGWLLQLLGAVLGIIQAALGLNIIVNNIKIIWA